MSKLGEAHIEQIKIMRADGKPAGEIKKFLKDTYGIDVSEVAIYNAAKSERKQNPESADATPIKKRRHAHRKRKAVSGKDDLAPDQAIKDIVALLAEIHSGYKLVFAHLRRELIKSRAEVCQMLTGAGIEVPESNIE